MPSKHSAPDAADEPEIAATEQAVPVAAPDTPPTPPAPEAPAAPTPPVRAQFHGGPGEYLTPLLLAERDPETGVVTERILRTPGRDLTEDDWQAMPPEQRAYIRQSRHFSVQTDAQMRAHRSA